MKIYRKKSLLYKYLITNFLILLIPILIMAFTLYKSNIVNLRQEVEASGMQRLIQTKDVLDMKLKELELLSYTMAADTRLMPYMMENFNIKTQEGIEELKRYKARSAFVDEIGLYFRGSDTIFTSFGSSSVSTYISSIYKYENWPEKEFYNDINDIKYSQIRPVDKVRTNNIDDNKHVITCIYPLAQDKDNPYGTVIFLINQQEFNNLINNTLGKNQGAVYIFDKDKNIISSVNNQGFIPSDKIIDEVEKTEGQGIQSFSIKNQKYSLLTVKSDSSGLFYAAVMPSSQFFQEVVKMKYLVIWILLVTFILGIGTVITASFTNYRPIRKLNRIVDENLPEDLTGDGEVERIESLVIKTISQRNDLENTVNFQIGLMREQLITNLIKGKLSKSDNVMEMAKTSKTNLSGPIYTVMVVSSKDILWEEKISFLQKSNIIEELEKKTEDMNAIVYGIQLTYENLIVFFVNINSQDQAREKQLQLAENINECFRNYKDMINIGIGNAYSELGKVYNSYLEACTAIEHSYRAEGHKVVFFEDSIASQKELDWDTDKNIARLTQSLKQENLEVAKEGVNLIIKDVKYSDKSIQSKQYVLFMLVNVVFKTFSEMNIKISPNETEGIINYKTEDELCRLLELLFSKVRKDIEKGKENKNIELCNSILLYIQARYKDASFSLDSLAEEFDLSIFYLSRFLKENTGHTFSDYVANLRVEEIKRLLVETNRPLKDIIIDVGYLDVPSFIRKFKKMEGITPGQYRELNNNNNK